MIKSCAAPGKIVSVSQPSRVLQDSVRPCGCMIAWRRVRLDKRDCHDLDQLYV